MYRNEWDAAVARASALEQQLRAAQSGQQADAATIAQLTQQLQQANAELARLRGQAGYGYPPPAPPMYGYGGYPQGAYVTPARGGSILVYGILSLVVCGLLGPVAWSMGNEELRRIDRGEVDPSTRGNVTAGRVCGMISSILLIITGVMVLFLLVLAAGASN